MNLKAKTVLVTGADGFIGSHLVEKKLLKMQMYKSICFYNSFNNFRWLNYQKI